MPCSGTIALAYLTKIRDLESTFILPRFYHAAVALTSQDALYDGRGAADPGVHRKSLKRAIQSAGAAFHAGVLVFDFHQAVGQVKNVVRTYFQTNAASRAFFGFQLKTDYVA
jgi:hypothetical protein